MRIGAGAGAGAGAAGGRAAEHGNPDRTAAQHRTVSRLVDGTRLAALACQVPRTTRAGVPASNLHAASVCRGYDMVALQQGRGYSPTALDLGRMRFFSGGTLRIDPIRDVLADRGRRLADEFHLGRFNGPDRRRVAEMLGGFEGALASRTKFVQLIRLARMHEALNSPPEFERMRGAIREGRFGEYASRMLLLRSGARHAAAGDDGQTLITDFVEEGRGRARRRGA